MRCSSSYGRGTLHKIIEQDVRKCETSDIGYEYALVRSIMKYTDKGYSAAQIQKKTGAQAEWINDSMRMYLTHKEISVQGILDRMEIRNR